jgi:hypothetical protein
MASAEDNTTLSGLTLKFALAAVVVIGIQSFPVSAIITMPLMGFYWLGAIVNLYMVSIAYAVFTGRLPRRALVIPVVFYALGLSAGVYSDVMAWRWASRQTFLEEHGTVPTDVRYVAFNPFNKMMTFYPLSGALRPEKAGFSFAALRFPSKFNHSSNCEWLPVEVPEKISCTAARLNAAYEGGPVHRIADRCYIPVSIPPPDKFLRVGGPMRTDDPQTESASPPPLQFPWGTIFFDETNIVLHDGKKQDVVGKLRGGLIRKLPYFFPAFLAQDYPHARVTAGGACL